MKLIATLAALAATATVSLAGTTIAPDGSMSSSTALPAGSGDAYQRGWNLQVTLNYVSGLSDLTDTIEKHNPLFDLETVIPVGVSIYPYYDFGNGLAVGSEIGPVVIGTGDASFYVIPVSLDVRYTFTPDARMSPFIRAGVQYAFAGGDFIDTGDVGFYAKAGVEFGHGEAFGWGFEVGYSTTAVDVLPGGGFGTEDAKPYEFTAGIFARF